MRGETWAGAFEIKFNDGKSHSFRMLAHKYTLNVFAKSSIAMQTQDFPPFMYVYFGCMFSVCEGCFCWGHCEDRSSPIHRTRVDFSPLSSCVFHFRHIYIALCVCCTSNCCNCPLHCLRSFSGELLNGEHHLNLTCK